MKVGDKIHAKKMAASSFYREAVGVVTAISGGFVSFQATKVLSKWGTEWEQHPTACATSCKVADAVVLA